MLARGLRQWPFVGTDAIEGQPFFRDAQHAWPEWSGVVARPLDALNRVEWNVKHVRRYDTADGFILIWLDLGPLGPELAASRHLIFYPFFLDGVLEDRQLVQPDGLHPTAAGVDVIVARVLPKAEEIVGRVRGQHAD